MKAIEENEIKEIELATEETVNKEEYTGVKCKLIKLHEIRFVDKGVCGDAYRAGGEKYYSVVCTFGTEDRQYYCEYREVYFLLTEKTLHRLLNEPFYYDEVTKKLNFSN